MAEPDARPLPQSEASADAEAAPWVVPPVLQVRDRAAIEILWHPAKRLHLRPFLGRACGLADAASALAIKKTAMSYWVQRLLDAGLIRPWTPERRGARSLPRYRAVADRFRLSLADAPHESYEAVFDDTSARWHPLARQALGRSLARQAPWLDLTIECREASGLATSLEAGAGAPADDYLYYWGRLWLTSEERDGLRRELDALWDRYAALSDRQGKPCPTYLHLLTVPDRGE